MTLGKRWYALRVEAGEGDEDGVRVHFPAVVEVTDGQRCAMPAFGCAMAAFGGCVPAQTSRPDLGSRFRRAMRCVLLQARRERTARGIVFCVGFHFLQCHPPGTLRSRVLDRRRISRPDCLEPCVSQSYAPPAGSVWRGRSTLHEFLTRAQLSGKPSAAAKKGQKVLECLRAGFDSSRPGDFFFITLAPRVECYKKSMSLKTSPRNR